MGIRLCGRMFFNVYNIRKDTYICSKHFEGGKGPTKENPDPLPYEPVHEISNNLTF